MNIIHSFDVFDTCLVRTFARPEDLFTELARCLLPPSATPEQIDDLARQRQQAEAAARHTSPREDITLTDIYRHLAPNLAAWRLSPRLAQTTEINLEIGCVRPVWAIRQRIAHLRRQGQRIIFISDMYLPAPVIRLMLVNRGLALPDDAVYISGDIGLTKASGRLFDHVLAQEGILPAQLHHYGDNPQADVTSARRRGIRVTYFQQSRLNRFEQTGLHAAPANLRQVGLSRAVRLSAPDAGQFAATLTGVVAPLLTAFVAWVLADANRQGLQRLYFVSRDGQILHEIAGALAQHSPAPECRYLYGSRQAWLLPSVTVCRRDALDWLLLHDKTPRSLLQKLSIDPADIAPALHRHLFDPAAFHRPLTPAAENRFWAMLESLDVAGLVLHKATVAREAALAYFAQEQLTADDRWALVDVGWAARGQRAVRRILRTQNPRAETRGYYLALADNRRPITETGPYRVFMTPDAARQFDSPGRIVLNNTMLFEHLFLLADHGTVVNYYRQENGWVPVLKNLPPHPFLQQFIPFYQQTVLNYVSEVAQSGLTLAEIAGWQPAALATTRLFITRPTPAEAQLAARLPMAVDQTHAAASTYNLARRLTLRDAAYTWRYALTSRFIKPAQRHYSPDYAWLEGSLALSPRWVGWLFWPVTQALYFKKMLGRRFIFDRLAQFLAKEKL